MVLKIIIVKLYPYVSLHIKDKETGMERLYSLPKVTAGK